MAKNVPVKTLIVAGEKINRLFHPNIDISTGDQIMDLAFEIFKRKSHSVDSLSCLICLALWLFSCGPLGTSDEGFSLEKHDGDGTIVVLRSQSRDTVLVQHARRGIRPYIHPIMSPDGEVAMTEYSPGHHKHQTGLYWGLKKVNGRDYFMNWKEDYWQRVSADVLVEAGIRVKWRTRYNLLDEKGNAILTETHTWSFREIENKFVLDLEWTGAARTNVTMEQFYVGGLFVRMPWREGVRGAVVNAVGQRNSEAEGQRAIWSDIGIQVEGLQDLAHIAMLDHPDNNGFPIPWRVDNELGVGPSRQILGDWTIRQGETEVIRYRLIAYAGNLFPAQLNAAWKEFVCE